ncbi:MBL fold metallo-hydrolase [Amnibacterium setariae]|uniref:MBL fold metallo-hydrolase n=1 Tax=Amnibacterium setariae TaxID=2306585 RepID=A0A3A1TYK5_9MICO|nr:MBL fold metallo-hydrolase [Amnibacterium setariae]RIX28671.1 MBL fold metallo-hydrolase [Amnibacterium setariae]
MRITKLEHAALILEEAGRRLVVDPGGLTNPILGVDSVDAVVITHEHADHWTGDQLKRLLDANPGVPILGPSGVARAAEGFDVRVVAPGETVEIASWTLRFFGGNHAVIHASIPVIENVGVLVNERLYYPGDSFYIPLGVEVDTLAAPAGAPWLKISEAMDYVTQLKPKRAFGTHDGVLSAAGVGLVHDRLKAVTEAAGGEYFALKAGDTIDV